MLTQETQRKTQTTQAWIGIMKHQLYGIEHMRHRARVARASVAVVAALFGALELKNRDSAKSGVQAPGDSP